MAPRRVGIISGWDTSSARLPAEDHAAAAIACIEAASCLRRPRKCWQTGSRRWRDGFASAFLSASMHEHLQSCPRSETKRDSHPSSPLCRLQRSDNSESTMRCEFRHRIAAPVPKQIISRTHRPPTVDQISVLPHARPSGNVDGSQPTVTIADKYKSRRCRIETSERRCGGQK